MNEEAETLRRSVWNALLQDIRADRRILLPRLSRPLPQDDEALFALEKLSGEANPYGGKLGDFWFQFEGEDDLLHLCIGRIDHRDLELQAARSIAEFLLEGVPPALIWLKPGVKTQHFYLGHDELLDALGPLCPPDP